MDDMTEVRLSFSQVMPRHQLAWDATSLTALKTCPRYYQYNILEGHVTRIENIHLRWGSEYNDALVTYNREKAKGASAEEAMLAALRFALVSTWDETLGRPWTSDLPFKTRETLIRSLVWYLTQFEEDALKTTVLPDGKAAVELSFRIHLDESSSLTGEDYLLCGYLDRKVEFNDREWITDWKTTRYALDDKYFAQYSPHNQVSLYTFAGNVISQEHAINGVIIDAVQLGVTFSRFQRNEIGRTRMQLEEWMRDSLFYIRQNEEFVKNDYWPQNDTSCDKYGGCAYRSICGVSPEIRPRLLDGLFHRRVWDPLRIREEVEVKAEATA
jgi:hypothetical protein